MSEHANSLEQEVLEELAARRGAFEARFPPEAFTGIAEALKIRPKPENLSRLRGRLLPEFYYLFADVPSKEPPREEQIRRLTQLREAATNLHSSIAIFEDVWPLNLLGPDGPFATDDMTDQFTATLQLLADTATGEIEKLAARKSRRGRPAKNAPFRQLTPILVRIYERLSKEPADCPYWLPDKGTYGGKGSFRLFALAVWRCLRGKLPTEGLAAIPSSEIGLFEEIRKHWPGQDPKR